LKMAKPDANTAFCGIDFGWNSWCANSSQS